MPSLRSILITLTLACVLLPVGWSVPAHAIGLSDLGKKASFPKTEKKEEKSDVKEEKLNLPPWTGPKKRLGVMDMEVKVMASTSTEPTTTGGIVSTTTISIPPPTDFGTGLSEMLTTTLVNSGRFIVLERKALMDIQAEQALTDSGATDASSGAGRGALLGAQALIRGAVTEYTFKRSSTGGNASILKGVDLAASKAEASVALDIRIYDTVTGQIIDSVRGEGRAKSSATAISIDKEDWKMAGSGFSQTPLGAATRQAINKAVEAICKRMDTMPWEGRVSEIDEDETGALLYLNAGSLAGLKENDRLEILRPGRPITDPETRVVIGRTRDTRLGSCQIDTVSKNFSTAVPLDGAGFKMGDVVRFHDPKAKTRKAPATEPPNPDPSDESQESPSVE